MQLNTRRGFHCLIYAGLLFTGNTWVANAQASDSGSSQQALTALKTPMDCPADDEVFSSAQGTFQLLICTPLPPDDTDDKPFENMPKWGQLRFIHQDPKGQETTTYWPIELDWLSSWVGGEGLQFWGNHLMTLDIGSERGGILYIANWTGKQFVISEYLYMTGDEDSMTLSWEPRGFIVDTVPDGVQRLVMHTNNDPMLGKFTQKP